jgi:hypothetical protein
MKFQLTFDAADPAALAGFWAEMLGYVLEPPPPGHDSWESWLRSVGYPEEKWTDASAIVDPERASPRIFFQRVPEPKSAKNRLHLDLPNGAPRDAPAEERDLTRNAFVARAISLGARELERHEELGQRWVVMADPEGNEFCIV